MQANRRQELSRMLWVWFISLQIQVLKWLWSALKAHICVFVCKVC